MFWRYFQTLLTIWMTYNHTKCTIKIISNLFPKMPLWFLIKNKYGVQKWLLMSFWCREWVCGSAVMLSACFITYASTGSGEGRKHHCITPCTQPVPTFPMWWAMQNTVRHNNQTQGQFLPTGHHSDEHLNQSCSVNNLTTPEHPLASIINDVFSI